MSGVTGLLWPEPHVKWNLGYWSREGQKRVVHKPLC